MQQAKRQRCSADDGLPSCSVCLHAFREQGKWQPLILECGHSLCKSCVRSFPLTSCPLCRKDLSQPRSSLVPNYALMQALAPTGSAGDSPAEQLLDQWKLEPGARLLLSPEQLVLGDVIKQGASGTVRKATLEGEQVAVKVLKLPPINGASVDSPQLSQLKNGLAALLHAGDSCHHVCRYLGFTVKGEDFCLVMPLYPNTLADLIQQQGSGGLPLPQALGIAQDIARGLEELHGQGVAVLDLKPQNVLITAQGMAVLGDFGLSALLSRTQGAATAAQAAGTYNYMSPEQMEEDSPVSVRADAWAFACTLIHMVTGQVPMAGLNLMQIMRKVCVSKQAASVPDGLPPQMKKLLSSCLQYDPATRPSAAEISQALREVSLQAPPPGPTAHDLMDIVLRRAAGGEETWFRLTPHTRFIKVIRAYAQRRGVRESKVRLRYQGVRVGSASTACELGLEHGAAIDVRVAP